MGLKLPFPKFLLKTPIQIYRTGVNTDGDYEEKVIYEGKCIYTDRNKPILDAERRLITLSGRVTVEDDISPGQVIEGYVKVNGLKKNIYSSERPLNPDGTVFSTEISLI